MPSTHARDTEAAGLVPTRPRAAGTGAAPEAGALSTRAERRLASGQWLAASAPVRTQARTEWDERAVTWLRPGVLFAAVVIRAAVVHAAVGMDSPEVCAPALVDALEGGPMFYTPDAFGPEGAYTALLPARVSQLPSIAGTVTYPQGDLLLVPPQNVTESALGLPWWVCPLDGPGLLCPPHRIALLAAYGRDVLLHAKGRRNA
jgi:hypothetical protein